MERPPSRAQRVSAQPETAVDADRPVRAVAARERNGPIGIAATPEVDLVGLTAREDAAVGAPAPTATAPDAAAATAATAKRQRTRPTAPTEARSPPCDGNPFSSRWTG
ncbi:hypothetical protein DV26_12335 [Amycolatopsis mediterranei]|nr:hypothetical protein DV26_12335 [Amycolatopsis mediterranei]KDU87131.1 hypothetical protein DV36_38085 [Amycolatopsis mediterranei]